MKRRDMLALGAGLSLVEPTRALAQAGAARGPHVAVLSWYSQADAERLKAVVDELAVLGWVDGKTITLEYHWAEGDRARAAAIAADLVRRKVDLIVARATPAILAAKAATTTIPIVMAPSADPIATGIVDNLARPGGNITGMSTQSIELAAKRLEILREAMPGVARIAFLGVAQDPNGAAFARETALAAAPLGLEMRTLMVSGPERFDAAFTDLAASSVQAVIIQPLFIDHHAALSALAERHRIALIGDQREFAVAGALIAFGASVPAYLQRIARYVDRILRGARPGELPIEQPTRFDLVVNLKTAKALGVTIADSLLARADEVIE